MRKRILAYRRGMDALLADGAEHDWTRLRASHLVQIGFFQHERLVHLIVTCLFALMELLCVAAAVVAFTPGLLLLCAALLVLLVPYIAHYYLLENETQRLYVQFDELERRCG